MTPLPGPLGGSSIMGWRLDKLIYASTWNSGIGAERNGGRWNNPGTPVVYAALDPATAILEVAVHTKLKGLDTLSHSITSFTVSDASLVRVVQPDEMPNPAWLQSSISSAGQRQFGERLLSKHAFVIIPSAVSRQSWNIIFNPEVAQGFYDLRTQERFALDTRLNPT